MRSASVRRLLLRPDTVMATWRSSSRSEKLLLVAGVIGAAMSADNRADLGLTTEAAWFVAICGGVALLAGLFGYRVRSRRRIETA